MNRVLKVGSDVEMSILCFVEKIICLTSSKLIIEHSLTFEEGLNKFIEFYENRS